MGLSSLGVVPTSRVSTILTGLAKCFAVYRQETDAIFVVLNLAWNADDHRLKVAVGAS